MVHRLSCSAACGIFPDQGSIPCLLHWWRILYHWATREAPNSFSWGQAVLRGRECSEHIAQWLFFPSLPAESLREFFSDLLCENLVGLLVVKLTKVLGSAWDQPHPLKFLTLKLIYTEPPAINYSLGSLLWFWVSLVALLVENSPTMQKTWVRPLGWEDALEKGKATHSSILAWRIPWTVESMRLQRVWQYWATFTFPFPSLSCLICVHRAPLDLKVVRVSQRTADQDWRNTYRK